ncbi:hypothetical protein MNBD_GAMMA13-982, partial [hydrothermal vent metagenome]
RWQAVHLLFIRGLKESDEADRGQATRDSRYAVENGSNVREYNNG